MFPMKKINTESITPKTGEIAYQREVTIFKSNILHIKRYVTNSYPRNTNIQILIRVIFHI